MKAIIAIFQLIGVSIFICGVLGIPFFLSWNAIPFNLPTLSWLTGSAMLFSIWTIFFVIYYARAIGDSISQGATQALKK